MSGNTWLEVIITLSIVVPLAIVAVLVWVFLRHAGDDPDEQRLRRAQEEWRQSHASDAKRR